MDPESFANSKTVYFLGQFWTFVAVSIAIALAGVAAKRLVAVLVPAERRVETEERRGGHRTSAVEIAVDPTLPLWYRVWRATISMHPVVIGALLGLTPIPVADWVPPIAAAHMLWFALAGALSGQVYDISRRLAEVVPAVIKQRLGVKSEPPPPPPSDPVPSTHTDLTDTLEPGDK